MSFRSNNSTSGSNIPSLVLDVLRLGAALTVLLIHAIAMWFPSTKHDANLPGDYSHAAVVLFFILSGYVIAFTTYSKNRGEVQYFQARLSRLYSIVLPGILITGICQFLVSIYDYELYRNLLSNGNIYLRYLIATLFLNEIWFLSSTIPMNGPLWSLGYEFWYYIIFGFWFFKAKGWKGLLLPAAMALIAGPKILLMMPIWLAGVLIYKAPRPRLHPNLSYLMILFTIIIAFFSFSYLSPYPRKIGSVPLFWAGQFLTDYVLCFFISFSIWLIPVNVKKSNSPTKKIILFREIADLTFPIYVLHKPLLILFKAVFGFKENNISQLVIVIIVVLTVSAFLGYGLNKLRPFWISLFGHLLLNITSIKNRISQRARLVFRSA